MKNKITLLITVYNRQKNIASQLDFWKDSGFQLLIVDSSNQKVANIELPENAQYHHHAQGTFYQILRSSLEFIQTPYVIQINDDDFVLPAALSSGIAFLEKHPEYVSYQGSLAKFNEKGEPTNFFYGCRGIDQFQKIGHRQDKLSARLEVMQRTFISPNHAIFRREVLLEAYELVDKHPRIQSIKYFDWIIGFVSCVKGRFYLSKKLFHLRSEERLIEDMEDRDYPKYLQREKRLENLLEDEEARKILVKFMVRSQVGMDDSTAGRLIKDSLKRYLKLHRQTFLQRLMWKIQCLPRFLNVQYQLRFPYRREFKRVSQLVQVRNK